MLLVSFQLDKGQFGNFYSSASPLHTGKANSENHCVQKIERCKRFFSSTNKKISIDFSGELGREFGVSNIDHSLARSASRETGALGWLCGLTCARPRDVNLQLICNCLLSDQFYQSRQRWLHSAVAIKISRVRRVPSLLWPVAGMKSCWTELDQTASKLLQ